MLFLAGPGGASKAAWDDAYVVMYYLHRTLSPKEESIVMCRVISVALRVAIMRKIRLPDTLHNLVWLNASSDNKRAIKIYKNMLDREALV